MSFKKNKYVVIREAVSKDLAEFIYNYFLMKTGLRYLFSRKIFESF